MHFSYFGEKKNYDNRWGPTRQATFTKKLVGIYFSILCFDTVGVSLDTNEHLDSLDAWFPWCAEQQAKSVKSKNVTETTSTYIIFLYSTFIFY